MRALPFVCLLAACGVVKNSSDAGAPGDVVSISPSNPKTNDELVATVTGVTGFTLQWSKDGTVRSDISGPIVSHLLTTRGELWRVDVLSGTTVVGSAEVTILNTPPPAPVLHVTPAPPGPGFPIKCAIDAPTMDDADGDTVTNTITWMKNGAAYAKAIKTTLPGDTVPVADVAETDAFICTVTASDGTDMTSTSSAVATAQCAKGGSANFAANGTFETGTIQTFTAATNICAARFDVAGAKGGSGNAAGTNNTNGAEMIGTFPLLAGTQLKILVGQAAQPVTGTAAQLLAGGGGTFVVDVNNQPLIIAGGGGSNFTGAIPDAELEGRIVTSGGVGPGGTRADNGAGGTSLNTTSSGGGGLLTDGANGGGAAFIHGGKGSVGNGEYHAGFGGGGNRTAGNNSGSFGEGGGGGYSGGSCSNGVSTWVGCGGGGSINLGANQSNTAGVNTGNGFVKITW